MVGRGSGGVRGKEMVSHPSRWARETRLGLLPFYENESLVLGLQGMGWVSITIYT